MTKNKTNKIKTQHTISLLLSGRSKLADKYAGKHVLVVKDRVLPLRDKREEVWKDINNLKKQYAEQPTITFVPRKDITYLFWRLNAPPWGRGSLFNRKNKRCGACFCLNPAL